MSILPPGSPAPEDLIPVREACQLVPSPLTGRRTCSGTLYRWILKGRLTAWRRGRWLFVSRAEVLQLLQPVRVEPPKRLATSREVELATLRNNAWADKTLRELGVR